MVGHSDCQELFEAYVRLPFHCGRHFSEQPVPQGSFHPVLGAVEELDLVTDRQGRARGSNLLCNSGSEVTHKVSCRVLAEAAQFSPPRGTALWQFLTQGALYVADRKPLGVKQLGQPAKLNGGLRPLMCTYIRHKTVHRIRETPFPRRIGCAKHPLEMFCTHLQGWAPNVKQFQKSPQVFAVSPAHGIRKNDWPTVAT